MSDWTTFIFPASFIEEMKTQSSEGSKFVIVPYEKLSEEALFGLIDEFILREGTDYGRSEYTLEEKHQHVRKQILSGKAVVVFDLNEESASLIRREQLGTFSE